MDLIDIDAIMLSDVDARVAEGRRTRLLITDFVRENLARPEVFDVAITCGAEVRFNINSLPGWLKLAEIAGVAHIPARELGSASVQSYMDMWDEHDATFETAAAEIVRGLAAGEMLRMEHVAPGAVKSALGYGREMTNGLDQDGSVDLCDMRFVDTLMHLYEEDVRFFARPILETRKLPGSWDGIKGKFPEEYRVIVEGGRLIGVSNYYPQCRMQPETHGDQIRRVIDMASAMMCAMKTYDIAPYGPGLPQHPKGPSFTMDFLTKTDGSLVFLEGGPPALVSAHPCCFLVDEGIRGTPKMHGVAFSTIDPIMELADLGIDVGALPDLRGIAQPVIDLSPPDSPSP